MKKLVLTLLICPIFNLIMGQELTIDRRVDLFVNTKGDTLLLMKYEDGRILLEDLLNCQITDTILQEYKEMDKLTTKKITLLNTKIEKQDTIISNKDIIIKNLNTVIDNKDKIITLKDDEIRHQKKLKKIGFIGCIVLPIITIILMN
jgi:hypothetical protein